ncbi:divalent cation tolerance protein, CutA1 family [Teladorsagia circumcincta]|uniref:Divalent cation tolerance protein, CutA1 family n=1 Tax=Teladorsagia circumcincta TaxID=45464 RepID=A0A2G9UEV8_TELCI|nr:divalent cation tolerance protein, CutA1 family [Teladorsagia circumcincta]
MMEGSECTVTRAMASAAGPALTRMGNIRVVYVTAPSKEVALKIANYEWQGQLHEDSEVVMIMKTRDALVVIENHTYDVPAFVSLATDAESFPYAQWLLEQTNSTKSGTSIGKDSEGI